MTLRELKKIYRALGARKRIEILKLLSDGGEKTVGDIASAIHLSFKSTSKHLVLLRQAGFLERRQVVYVGLYSLEGGLMDVRKQLVAHIRQSE